MRILIMLLMVVVIGVNMYVWSLSISNYSSFIPTTSPIALPSRSPSISLDNSAQDSCAQFQTRFGTSVQELIDYINSQPESAQVMKDYRNLYGTIISLTPVNNLPFNIFLDTNGKVTGAECAQSNDQKDYAQDFDFTIPETDFAQIVRYREQLEANQAGTYLQNLKTTPDSVKQTILERIQALENQ